MASRWKAVSSSAPAVSAQISGSRNRYLGRDALGTYITSPEKHEGSPIITYDRDFVVIYDKFPKSSVHILLLPRDLKFSKLHPIEALDNIEFLEIVRLQLKKVKAIVAQELQRKYGPFLEQYGEREAVLGDQIDLEEELPSLPSGRNWENEVMSGIHSRPSMNHLHIHVMSVDRYSDSLKHRKHYNSFATRFFIPIEDFPLAKDDARREPEREGYLNSDLKCWRCGKNFGRKFTELKKHLSEEFEDWKRNFKIGKEDA